MASTFAVTRNHLIFGLCLPLAVLMGYLLAEPFESTSLTLLLMIASVLIVPMLLRWYHPLLILSWNMTLYVGYLPGSPQLWALDVNDGAVLRRPQPVGKSRVSFCACASHHPVPCSLWCWWSLQRRWRRVALDCAFWDPKLWAEKDIFICWRRSRAILPCPVRRSRSIARPCVLPLFFLPGLTAIFGRLLQAAPSALGFLFAFFPPEADPNALGVDNSFQLGMTRASGIFGVAMAIFSWLLARHGIAGVFNFTRPWRMAILITAVSLGTFGGFRSGLVLMGHDFSGPVLVGETLDNPDFPAPAAGHDSGGGAAGWVCGQTAADSSTLPEFLAGGD